LSPALAQAQTKPLTTITRGTVSTTAAEWPDVVAKRKGFYEKEGLKVEQAMISPTTITSSLIGGSIQIGFINGAAMVQAIEAGADLVAFGQGMDPAPYTLMAKKEIKTIADLKGKTISLADEGDVYTVATKEILRKGGLDPDKDINFRYGGNSNQRMAALVAGAVDGVPLIPPQDRMMTDQGFTALAYYPDHYPNLTLSLSAVTRAWATKNPEIMKSFMRAQASAIAWLYDVANKAEAIDLLMKETNADRAAAEQAYDVFLVKMKIFPPNGCIQTKGMQVMVDILSSINKAVKGGPADRFVDTQWCVK
jgi:NitT/TauT family transport system substrate-binding protein